MHFSFDFDYTLADSSSGTVACASYALERMGREVPDSDAIRRTIGNNLPTTFFLLTGEDAPVLTTEFERLFLEHADEVMAEHIRIYDGVPACLASLRTAGHEVSIVSTKTAHRIRTALELIGIDGLVAIVVGGDEVTSHKPDPQGLLRAMERIGAERHETLYVGDSVVDGECADRAGVRFIGVRSGVTPANELERWRPWLLLDSATDIPRALEIA